MTQSIRLIRPEEWAELLPVFEAQGGRLPDPENATAAVAFDAAGQVCGFWVLQRCWHAGPLWIRPDCRRSGLWRRLHAALDRLFTHQVGAGYYSFSGSEQVEAIFRKLGYRDLGYKVWAREAGGPVAGE